MEGPPELRQALPHQQKQKQRKARGRGGPVQMTWWAKDHERLRSTEGASEREAFVGSGRFGPAQVYVSHYPPTYNHLLQ